MINGDIMVSKSSYNTTNGPNSTYEQVTSNQIQIYNGTEPNIDEGTMLEESKLDPPQLKGDEIVSKNLSGTTKIFHPIPKDAVSSNLTSQLGNSFILTRRYLAEKFENHKDYESTVFCLQMLKEKL